MNIEQSIDILKKGAKPLFAHYPIELAYLYGSAASGKTSQFSDVDIALVLTPNSIIPSKRLRFEMMIENEIAERCNISNADVRVVNDAPLALRGQVVTEGILLYARNETLRIEFETQTRSEFFDFQPMLNALRNSFFDTVLEKGIDGKHAKNRRNVAQSERLPSLSQ